MIKKKRPVSSLFIGNYKTNFKGRGIEFTDFSEYNLGDDVKNIDFLKSSQEGKTLIRRFQEEREGNIIFIFDISDTLELKTSNQSKLETMILNFQFLSKIALKNNDKIGALFVNGQKYDFFPPKKGIDNIQYILNNFENNHIFDDSTKINESLSYFLGLPLKDCLVFLCTDKIDEIDQKYLKILSQKHELIYVNILDEFEYNISQSSGMYNFGEKLGNSLFGFGNIHKISQYNTLQERKIKNFRKKIFSYNASYILLDNQKNLNREWNKFFYQY